MNDAYYDKTKKPVSDSNFSFTRNPNNQKYMSTTKLKE
jgi:hypothetical protein